MWTSELSNVLLYVNWSKNGTDSLLFTDNKADIVKLVKSLFYVPFYCRINWPERIHLCHHLEVHINSDLAELTCLLCYSGWCMCVWASSCNTGKGIKGTRGPPCDLHGTPVFTCLYLFGVCGGHTLWMCTTMHFWIENLHTYTVGHRCWRKYVKDRAGARICKTNVNAQTKWIHCIWRLL